MVSCDRMTYTFRHQFLLDYMKKFHLVYKDVPTFSFNMMTEYTHSNNNPAQYVDEDLVKTLETLRRNNVSEVCFSYCKFMRITLHRNNKGSILLLDW